MHDAENGGRPAADARERQTPGDEPAGPQVPLAAVLSERERRRAAEKALEALRAQVAAAPEGHQGDPLDALNARFQRSERAARQRHGEAAVDAARTWVEARMRQDHAFAREILAHADPYDLAVVAHAREGRGTAPREAEEAQPQGEPKPAPPRSLVSQPSAGGAAHTPIGPGQAYDALFNR
jgi:hypothetical protein